MLTNDHVVAGTTALQAEVDGVNYSARIVGEAPCQVLSVCAGPGMQRFAELAARSSNPAWSDDAEAPAGNDVSYIET